MIRCCTAQAVIAFSEEVEIRRPRSGSYDNHGRWIDGIVETLKIRAAVQPASGEDLSRLDEGDRTKETIKLYSPDEIKVSKVANQTTSDVVLYGEKEYLVNHVEDWTQAGGFYKAIAVKRGQ